MRTGRVFHAVDSHTEGMPTRWITRAFGFLPGARMNGNRLHWLNERDDLRTRLRFRPRGHASMGGSILQRSTRPASVLGAAYIG